MRPRLRRFTTALALVALPAMMGARGRCGFALDFSGSYLIPEPVDRVVIDSYDGTIVSVAYDRAGVEFKRHVFAFEPSIGDLDWDVEGTDLVITESCKFDDNCSFDHWFELQPHIGFDVTMRRLRAEIGYTTGDIKMVGAYGWFKGVQLGSKNITLEYGEADVTIEMTSAPEAIDIATDGAVILVLPPGSYRCDLTTDGEVVTEGITCDDAAAALLRVDAGAGDIDISAAA